MNIIRHVNLKNICKTVAIALMCNNFSALKHSPRMANFNKKNVLISQKIKIPIKNHTILNKNNTQKNKISYFHEEERKYVKNNILKQNNFNNMQNKNNPNNSNKQKLQNNHYIEEQNSNLQTTQELEKLQRLNFEIDILSNQYNVLLQKKEYYINIIKNNNNLSLQEQVEIKNNLKILEKTINTFIEMIINKKREFKNLKTYLDNRAISCFNKNKNIKILPNYVIEPYEYENEKEMNEKDELAYFFIEAKWEDYEKFQKQKDFEIPTNISEDEIITKNVDSFSDLNDENSSVVNNPPQVKKEKTKYLKDNTLKKYNKYEGKQASKKEKSETNLNKQEQIKFLLLKIQLTKMDNENLKEELDVYLLKKYAKPINTFKNKYSYLNTFIKTKKINTIKEKINKNNEEINKLKIELNALKTKKLNEYEIKINKRKNFKK